MDSTTTEGNVSMQNGSSAQGQAMSKEAEKRMNRVYRFIFLFLLIDLIAFTVILPLLPGLLNTYGRDDKKISFNEWLFGDDKNEILDILCFTWSVERWKIIKEHLNIQSGLYNLLRYISSSFRSFIGIKEQEADPVFLGGLVNSLFSLLQFLSSPIIGAASDVYGRRRMMLFCMVGVALSYILWMVSHNFLIFVFARLVGGMSKGNVNLSTSIVTDVSNKDKRGKGMAMIGIAFSLGFIIGPAVGASFTARVKDTEKGIYYLYPALFAFVLTSINIVLIYLFMEETLPANKRIQEKSYIWENAGKLISPKSIFNFVPVQKLGNESKASVRRLGLIYFLFMFIYSGLEFTLPFLMTMRYRYNSMSQGKMFFFIGVMMLLVQGGYTRRLKADKQRKAAIRGMILLMPAFLLLGVSETEFFNFWALPLFAFSSATVVPCLTTLISSYGGDDQKGVILGIFRSLGALARATGPMFFSAIFWLFGDKVAYGMGAVALFIPLILFRGRLKDKD